MTAVQQSSRIAVAAQRCLLQFRLLAGRVFYR